MGESCPATLKFMLCSPLAGISLVGSRSMLLERLNMDWLLRDSVSRVMSAGGILCLALLFTGAAARTQGTAYPNDGTSMVG